ncbi:MAG TPA: putative baseplate assembly protein [Blastocatellia bacterium]|nr:putative baseplate assembly protein [Blastocatellia bacterium]
MPVRPPVLDDRSFDDLVAELLARIPAHTPEWTNPRLGDPGRTLLELFAWLTDTMLYRVNLIPERQRLAFLRLLGQPMRAAIPARGVVTLGFEDEKITTPIYLRAQTTVKGAVNFETLTETTVLPITGEVYCKRTLTEAKRKELAPVIAGLQEVYQLQSSSPIPYQTSPVFPQGAAQFSGFDVIQQTVDKCLWIALLAPKKEQRQAVKNALGKHPNGAQQLLSIGLLPSIEAPPTLAEIKPRLPLPHIWEITSSSGDDKVDYIALDPILDTTAGLTQRGVVRLALPAANFIGAPSNDVRKAMKAGVGDFPPRLDVVEKAERLVAWVRLRPMVKLEKMSFSWVGINAVEIDQRQTLTNRIIGQSDGSGDQVFPLPGQSVDPHTIQIEVEEDRRGFQPWRAIDDLALAGDNDAVFYLDAEAGTIQFGNGVRGRVPDAGARIKAAFVRSGGGQAGNLPAGLLTELTNAKEISGQPISTKLKVTQSLPTEGGEEAETLADAERRIPALFRHRERAVTQDDYRQIAAQTPGVRLGRVEIIERFKPQQRRFDVPGVVSVMVWPYRTPPGPPNPRPDRPFLESVHAYLDARRPLSTELYTIGCEYVSLGLSTGITIRDGFGREEVVRNVRESLFGFLWALAPGGIDNAGWPLGRPVQDREVEVVIARVPGVRTVNGINLFERSGNDWRKLSPAQACGAVRLALQPWQLPELLSVVVAVDADAPLDLRAVPNPFADVNGVAVPVVPEVC